MNAEAILALANAIIDLKKRLDVLEELVVLTTGTLLIDRGTITEEELREVLAAQ